MYHLPGATFQANDGFVLFLPSEGLNLLLIEMRLTWKARVKKKLTCSTLLASLATTYT